MMSAEEAYKPFRCRWGFHNFEVEKETSETEGWHRAYYIHGKDVPVPGSNFTRTLFTRVEKCSRCGFRRGIRVYDDGQEKDRLTAEYAEKEIERIEAKKVKK